MNSSYPFDFKYIALLKHSTAKINKAKSYKMTSWKTDLKELSEKLQVSELLIPVLFVFCIFVRIQCAMTDSLCLQVQQLHNHVSAVC